MEDQRRAILLGLHLMTIIGHKAVGQLVVEIIINTPHLTITSPTIPEAQVEDGMITTDQAMALVVMTITKEGTRIHTLEAMRGEEGADLCLMVITITLAEEINLTQGISITTITIEVPEGKKRDIVTKIDHIHLQGAPAVPGIQGDGIILTITPRKGMKGSSCKDLSLKRPLLL
jgi:hypothetical protein